MAKKKPHQRTSRQRKKPYALIGIPKFADADELPTLKLSPRLILIRPLCAVVVNGEVVALAGSVSRAHEWASTNVVVTRKIITSKER